MEELLYESIGMPLKRKKTLKVALPISIICGTICILFSYQLIENSSSEFLEGGMLFLMMGIVFYAVAVLGGIEYAHSNNSILQLAIYTDHVIIYDKKDKKQLSFEWNKIYQVGKQSIFGEGMLFLETEKGDYVVEVNDLNKAHHIMEQKLLEKKEN